MRIIKGSIRGSFIPMPSGVKIRPTTNRAKEALFDVIENYYDLDRVAVLDLFAGSGSIGFEFASRGAPVVTMVEKHPRARQALIRFARQKGLDNVEVLGGDSEQFVRHAPEQYDIVFMDPPYHYPAYARLIDAILRRGLVSPGGRLIVEHYHKLDFSDHPDFEQQRKYGQSVFSFFKPERP